MLHDIFYIYNTLIQEKFSYL